MAHGRQRGSETRPRRQRARPGLARGARLSPLVLDLSRLLSRAGPGAPTGIDRVELAYAEHLVAVAPDSLSFAGLNRLGRVVAMPGDEAKRLITLSGTLWRSAGGGDAGLRRLALRLRATMLAGGRPPAGATYLLISHHHLNRPAAIEAWLGQTGGAFVCMVHDLIPIEFAEYARPGEAAKHRLRMETVARLADGVIVNSAATGRSLRTVLDRVGRAPPVVVAPLGIELPDVVAPVGGGRYFVCVGTIEPRKNHLLLLHVWRRLAERPSPPRLVLVGRRGWENENVVDMIERCAPLQGLVEERRDLSDREMSDLLRGARALLLPSFAEGYGLPLAEALALGVPALCSDLAALREVGAEVPEYLDPLDGPAWLRAILDYADADSASRELQLARLREWRAPTWEEHMSAALVLVGDVAGRERVRRG